MKPALAAFAWAALWTLACVLVAGALSAGLVALVALIRFPEIALQDAMASMMERPGPLMLVLGIAPTALVFGAAAIAKAERAELRLAPAAPVDHLLTTIGMIAISTAAGALVALLGLVDEGALGDLNRMFLEMPMGARALVLPVTALLPGVAEELFFRGLVLGRVAARVGRGAAIGVSALAFGLVHMDPGHALAASIMGLYLGFVVDRAQSVRLTIFAHVANNALATLAPELNGTAGGVGREAYLSLAIGALVGVAAALGLARRHAARP